MARLIDRHPPAPTRELEVCCIGLPKTGSESLHTALSRLGYRTYHGFDPEKSGKRDMDLLHEALGIKSTGSAKPYGRREFDKIWAEYDALIGLPAFAFVEELLEAYPEAKFVLTERNIDSWLSAMQQSVFAEANSWSLRWESLYDPWHARPFQRLLQTWLQSFCRMDFGEGAKEAYADHVMLCKKLIPEDRLLVLRFEDTNDWQELCQFLGKDVLNEPYHRSEDEAEVIHKE